MIAQIDNYLQPKQALFWQYMQDMETEHLCYGGGRKGGKSLVARRASLFRRMAFPGSAGLILRETEDEVMANHWLPLQEQAYKWGVECIPNKNDMMLTFPQFKRGKVPSQIFLGYGRRMDDVKRYQGNPYLDIMFDEATNMMWEMMMLISGSLANEHWGAFAIPKNFYTCNPGGIGTADVLKNLVEASTRMKKAVFILALLHDNQIFLEQDPNFESRMREQYRDQPHVIAQWLEGDWYASPGSYFAFDRKKVLRPMRIPYWAKFSAGVDYGYWPDKFAVIYSAKWRDPLQWKGQTVVGGGKFHKHIFSEIYQTRLELDEQAQAVKDREKYFVENGVPNFPARIPRYAGGDIQKKQPREKTEKAGKTIRNVWARHGFTIASAAYGSRVEKWMLLRYLLKNDILTIDPACMGLIAELSGAQHEKSSTGHVGSDIDPDLPQDALDGLGYDIAKTFGSQFMERHKKWSAELHERSEEDFFQEAA